MIRRCTIGMIKISSNTIRKNLKSNLKLMGLIVSICIILGVLIGIGNAQLYQPEKKLDKTELESKINLADLDQNGAYYFNAFFLLKQKSDYLNAYLDYLTQVDLDSKSRKKLRSVEMRLKLYDDTEWSEAFDFYKNTALSIDNQSDSTIQFYNKKIKALKEERKKEIEKLDETINGKYTEDYKEVQQKTSESKIIKIDQEIDIFENLVSLISNTNEAIIHENCLKANQILETNYQDLNDIVDVYNSTLESISNHENYEIIYNKRMLSRYENTNVKLNNHFDEEQIMKNNVNNAIIYAKSIEGLDMPMERFFSTLTFFCLFGVVIALIIGGIYDKGNKEDEQ